MWVKSTGWNCAGYVFVVFCIPSGHQLDYFSIVTRVGGNSCTNSRLDEMSSLLKFFSTHSKTIPYSLSLIFSQMIISSQYE